MSAEAYVAVPDTVDVNPWLRRAATGYEPDRLILAADPDTGPPTPIAGLLAAAAELDFEWEWDLDRRLLWNGSSDL
ncbi:MAG TPA: hypothetical protein VNQ73_02600 [Ilumatobacter sp.]|nr:hypothetical protein [Ilumatobacter sp.]